MKGSFAYLQINAPVEKNELEGKSLWNFQIRFVLIHLNKFLRFFAYFNQNAP